MNDFVDYSIDIETLGTRPGCTILSIGCVQFDRNTGKLGGEFYVEIDLMSLMKCGHVDADTLRWWIDEIAKDGKKAALFRSGADKKSFATALDEFSKWMRNAQGGIPVTTGMNKLGGARTHTAIVWGNGASFDISILEEGYRIGGYGLSVPWQFRHIRDMRTIVDAAQFVKPHETKLRDADHHNALADAKWQAQRICECFAILRGGVTKNSEDDEL